MHNTAQETVHLALVIIIIDIIIINKVLIKVTLNKVIAGLPSVLCIISFML